MDFGLNQCSLDASPARRAERGPSTGPAQLFPRRSEVPQFRVSRVSILGIVIIGLDYIDTYSSVRLQLARSRSYIYIYICVHTYTYTCISTLGPKLSITYILGDFGFGCLGPQGLVHSPGLWDSDSAPGGSGAFYLKT